MEEHLDRCWEDWWAIVLV